MKTILSLVFLALPLATPVSAQAIEDPGPNPVGWRDVQFTDTNFGRGNILGRIYYPAQTAGENTTTDPASGPYPLVGFQHGWLGQPSSYDDISTHLASWGFVVASIGTETGFFGAMEPEARDTQALLHWVDEESQTTGAWLEGMTWSGDWAATGHSMGGGALMYLIGLEPRVKTIVGLQPYSGSSLGGSAGGYVNLRAWEGEAYYIAGEVDDTVPPDTMVYDYFLNGYNLSRNVFTMVEGMGHCGPCDGPPDNEPLPGAEQARMHRRLLTGIMRYELYEERHLMRDILGEGIQSEPVVYQSDCLDPVFWVDWSMNQPGDLVVGIAGKFQDDVTMAWSLAPDMMNTPYGLLGIDLNAGATFHTATLVKDRVEEVILPVQGSWSGQVLYVQALADGASRGMLTEVFEIPIP